MSWEHSSMLPGTQSPEPGLPFSFQHCYLEKYPEKYKIIVYQIKKTCRTNEYFCLTRYHKWRPMSHFCFSCTRRWLKSWFWHWGFTRLKTMGNPSPIITNNTYLIYIKLYNGFYFIYMTCMVYNAGSVIGRYLSVLSNSLSIQINTVLSYVCCTWSKSSQVIKHFPLQLHAIYRKLYQ